MSFTGKRAIYPLLRTVLKSRTVGAGETAAVVNDLHSGRLPSQVIFGLVENSAFRGHRQKNPYHFRNYDITSCQIVVNSKSYPSVRFTPKFEATLATSKIMREYAALMKGIGVNGNDAPLVTHENFFEGCCLFAFDLSPDGCNNFHLHKVDRGVMNVEINFGTELPHPVTIVTYSVFSDAIEIDMDRLVYTSTSIQG